jgi:hypothetical protein
LASSIVFAASAAVISSGCLLASVNAMFSYIRASGSHPDSIKAARQAGVATARRGEGRFNPAA